MPKQTKIDQVQTVADRLESAKSAALVQYQGLTAADVASLRANVRKAGGQMEVVKNSLITRALLKLGIRLPTNLSGPTAIAYCDTDEIAPLKEIEKVNKEKEKTEFKFGIYDRKLLTASDLTKFLSLPSKTQLIAQLLGGLQNPLQRLVYAMRFNQQQLVMTLKAVADKTPKGSLRESN